ncbi:UDP-glycosyltransferase [Lacinutrix sp. Bg11-31]|uniref:UDP-glycosyltransferase n=1 Tax=Lacinutrix sp. Bg11-31 TaxID=2057808 RepID=UPI000C316D55|nr:UDP-glycosyltransferase [Lacinutrix sp. Bg11-31]AUC82065.1 UDP-glycosyltransferase [Lacinutrix sp. Bg11-31]
MKNKKIFILIPSGIALRNFAFTKFHDLAKAQNLDITYWNSTPFSISEMGYKEIRLDNIKPHWLTDILKNVRKTIELNLNIKNAGDPIYNAYKFPASNKSIKAVVKNVITKVIIFLFSSAKGLEKIKQIINKKERSTGYYNSCINTLKKEKPDFIFCTNQRIVDAIAPLLAARDIDIPTATFIFSWDNLPKATLVVDTDYYFVWSDFMKKEMHQYYPQIKANQIIVTGTPQFEPHYDNETIKTKEAFYKDYNLDSKKEYVCFSGDDVTTSPDDPKYLEDFAKAIASLNTKGYNLGIVFRKCPVDFSGRYDNIVSKYNGLIVEVAPKWQNVNNTWNTMLPSREDNVLLSNTIAHSLFVVNLGSSMVFDYAAFNKACGYFNYNQEVQLNTYWDIHQCYKYVHFRSMPNGAVIYFDKAEEIEAKIVGIINKESDTVEKAKLWFDTICKSPQKESSQRILKAITAILSKENI